ncbi:transglycosylase domain-containing protein [Sphaerisporangium sp. TRM90804]|uniref:transglycosylase domain-containing protein n=1 Tax=Sphaerisporangium sp. TRM90804 TaxID=3031113 RepID=UPI00244C5DAC|nr:transglycosylase domain-containing protein [Sphaerisporangium sp. TRM90804]MDH2425538.1 transglycosylase domain-containing protein [Sphaerisporangium sp. TRM90804]
MSYSSYGPEPTGRPGPAEGAGGSARPGRRRRSSQEGAPAGGHPAHQPPPETSAPSGRRAAPPRGAEETRSTSQAPPGRQAEPRRRGGDPRPAPTGGFRPPASEGRASGEPRRRRAEAAFEDTQSIGQVSREARPSRRDVSGTETSVSASPGAPGRSRRSRGGPAGPAGSGPGGQGPGGQGPGGNGPGDGPPGDGPGRRRARGGEPPRRRGWRRFVPNWKIVTVGFAVVVAGVFGMIAVGYANTELPTDQDAQEEAKSLGSSFYYADGSYMTRLGTERRMVKLESVPEFAKDAVVAAENDTFWSDAGISLSGIVRSAWSTATGAQVQGASTITQQMARSYFKGLSKERSVKRKITEIFIAVKLDKEWSKERVLEFYLNTIPFGRNTYGIEAAAREFFGHGVKDLTPAEAAYLAGRIQQPGQFDISEEKKDFSGTKFRFNYVLKQMAVLNPQKYGSYPAKLKFPEPEPRKASSAFSGLRGYMLTEALKELESKGLSRSMIETGGYKIYTTFDKKLMLAAKAAVKQTTAGLPREVHTGLAAVDPTNGRVVAFYGGDNYLGKRPDQFNEAFQARKQAASAFKPYVLAAWLEAGHSLQSYVTGKQPLKLEGTTPISNGHSTPSSMNIIYATQHSINTAYGQMGAEVGLDAVKRIAEDAGLSKESLQSSVDEHRYLFSIGSAGVTPVEQAGGYSIFANSGKHYPTHTVVKVIDREKVQIISEDKTPKQVIAEEVAADAVVALKSVVKGGTGTAAALPDRTVAGKTGTNNDNKEAWFVGFTPQLSAAVGIYKENRKTGAELPLGSSFEGGTVPARVWRAFMSEAMKGKPVKDFPTPSNIGSPLDLAPKPVPTPTPTPEDEFPDGGGDGWPEGGPDGGDNGGGDAGEGCLPWDDTCGNNDGGGGQVDTFDPVDTPGRAATPTPTPSPEPAQRRAPAAVPPDARRP